MDLADDEAIEVNLGQDDDYDHDQIATQLSKDIDYDDNASDDDEDEHEFINDDPETDQPIFNPSPSGAFAHRRELEIDESESSQEKAFVQAQKDCLKQITNKKCTKNKNDNKPNRKRKLAISSDEEEDVHASDLEFNASEPESECELNFDNSQLQKKKNNGKKKSKSKAGQIRQQLKNDLDKKRKRKAQYDNEADSNLPLDYYIKPNTSKNKSVLTTNHPKSNVKHKSSIKFIESKSVISSNKMEPSVDTISDSETDSDQGPLNPDFICHDTDDEEASVDTQIEKKTTANHIKKKSIKNNDQKQSQTSVPSSSEITHKLLKHTMHDTISNDNKTSLVKKVHPELDHTKVKQSFWDEDETNQDEATNDASDVIELKKPNKPIVKKKDSLLEKVSSELSTTLNKQNGHDRDNVVKVNDFSYVITHRGEELDEHENVHASMSVKGGLTRIGKRHYTTAYLSNQKKDNREYSILLLIKNKAPIILDSGLATKIEKQKGEFKDTTFNDWRDQVIKDKNVIDSNPKKYRLHTCKSRYEALKKTVDRLKNGSNTGIKRKAEGDDKASKIVAKKPKIQANASTDNNNNAPVSKTTIKSAKAIELSEDQQAQYDAATAIIDHKLSDCFMNALKAQTAIMCHANDTNKAQGFFEDILGPLSLFQEIKNEPQSNLWSKLELQHPQPGKLNELLKFFIAFNPKAQDYLQIELKKFIKSTSSS